MSSKEITGRHVLIVTVAAFGVIIGVNVFMAVMAVGTFPGLETKNTYVASQKFDADRAAQQALGWTVAATVEGGLLTLSITDTAGRPVNPPALQATLGRATHTGEDRRPDFAFDGTALVAPVDLAPGNWNLRLTATADDGTGFRQRIVLRVDDPA